MYSQTLVNAARRRFSASPDLEARELKRHITARYGTVAVMLIRAMVRTCVIARDSGEAVIYR